MIKSKLIGHILILLFILLAINLVADVNDDIRVINGLYQDSNYNLALQEIQRFRQNYPNHEALQIMQVIEGNIALHKQQYILADSLFSTVDATKLDENVQADLLLGRIQAKYFLGDYALSSILTSQYIHRYPQSEAYWQAIYWSARLDIKYQKYSDAIKSLHMIENRPEKNIIYAALVDAYAIDLQTNESERYLKSLIQEYPGSEYTHQAYLNQSEALYSLGQYDSLATYLNYTIPKESIYYNEYNVLLGKAAYMVHDYDTSLKYLANVKPENEEARFYKAMNYYDLHQDSKAKDIFVDLGNHAKDPLIRSNSFLQNQIMVFDKEQKSAIFNLDWYIQNHPNDPIIGAYYFQLGYSYYKQKKYNLAFENLTKAITYPLDSITEDKTYYLIGDIYYLTNDKIAAEQSLLDYIKIKPNGLFVDEALCKLGYINYDRKDTDSAKTYFQRIVEEFPNSTKWAISNFYLGEINYFKSNFIIAKKFYTVSLKGELDKGYIWLRIAQCDYFIEDYSNAIDEVKNIPEKKEMLFDKYILKGNIFFNENDFLKALDAYKVAEKHYQSKAEWEQVISQEGLTYYLLKKFPEATAIYKQLSQEASTPDKYLLLAANSAFSATDYQQSAYLYNQYLKNYPDAENRDKAYLGVADSHYNLGNYSQATQDYIDILLRYESGKTSDDALKALGWCLRLAKDQDFTVTLANLEQQVKDPTLRMKIKRIHLDYVNNMQEWNKTVQMADDLIQTGSNDVKIQMIKAEALAKLKRYNEADSVFTNIQPETLGPDAYLAWANIDMMKGDSLSALNKMKISSNRTKDSVIWIPLLTLQMKMNDPDFNSTYEEFIQSKPAAGIEDADLLWCEMMISKQQFENVETKLIELMKSNDRQVRGKAEFLEAKLSFLNGKYQDAIPGLARIKYLYPEMTDNVLESQYLLCICYIQTKDLETARTIYNSIKADLNSNQVTTIENGLASAGGER